MGIMKLKVPGPLKPIGRTIWRTVQIFNQIESEQRAAAFAYYAIFSMIPLATLLISTGSFFFSPDDIRDGVRDFVPVNAEQREMIWSMASDLEKARGGVSLISIGILLWTGMRFFQVLVHAANRAWHTEPNPWWQTPIKNLIMILVVGSGAILGILVPAILQGGMALLMSIEHWLHLHFNFPDLERFIPVVAASRLIGGGLVLFYTFSMLFMLAPRQRVSFRDAWVSALFVTIGLQICQIVVVEYLPRFVDYNSVYGSVGGIMLLMMSIYISGTIIIFGGCLCAARWQVKNGVPFQELTMITPSNSEN